MDTARDQVYDLVNQLTRKAAEEGPRPFGEKIEARMVAHGHLCDLLNRVEADAVHREAAKMRQRADRLTLSDTDPVADAVAAVLRAQAASMEPHEKVETRATTAQCTEFCAGPEHWHRKES